MLQLLPLKAKIRLRYSRTRAFQSFGYRYTSIPVQALPVPVHPQRKEGREELLRQPVVSDERAKIEGGLGEPEMNWQRRPRGHVHRRAHDVKYNEGQVLGVAFRIV